MSLLDSRKILVSGVGTKGVGTATLTEVRAQGGIPIITCHPSITDKAEEYRQGEELILPCDFSREKHIKTLCMELRDRELKIDGFLHSVANAPETTRAKGRTHLSMRTREMIEGLKLNAMSFHWLVNHLMGNGNPKRRILNYGAVGITMLFMLGSRRYIETYWNMAGNKDYLAEDVISLAFELGPQGLRLHGLDAGPMKTPASRGVPEFNALYEAAREIAPSRRNMTPEDAAWGICLLLSPRSAMFPPIVTMDGGLQTAGIVPVKDRRPEPT